MVPRTTLTASHSRGWVLQKKDARTSNILSPPPHPPPSTLPHAYPHPPQVSARQANRRKSLLADYRSSLPPPSPCDCHSSKSWDVGRLLGFICILPGRAKFHFCLLLPDVWQCLCQWRSVCVCSGEGGFAFSWFKWEFIRRKISDFFISKSF